MKRIFYGWYIVLICMICNTFGIGIVPVMGLFTAPLMARYGYSASAIGLTLSLFSVGMFCGYFVFGRILTRDNNKVILGAGCALQAASFALMGITELRVLAIAYPLCFIIGFVGGCIAISSPTIVNNWFVRNNGLAMGIVGAGTGLSSFMLAPLCSALIYSSLGIRGGYFALAGGGILSSTLIFLFLHIYPEKIGGTALGGTVKSVNASPASEGRDQDIAVRKSGSFRQLVVARFLLSLIYTLLFVQVATHIVKVGYDPEFSALIVSLYGAGLIGGKILIGTLCDRISMQTINIICYASICVCALCAVFIEHQPLLGYIYALGAGLGIPLQTVVYPVMLKKLYGLRDFRRLYAIVVQSAPLALAAGSYMAGLIFDAAGSYIPSFWLALGAAVLSYSLVRRANKVIMAGKQQAS